MLQRNSSSVSCSSKGGPRITRKTSTVSWNPETTNNWEDLTCDESQDDRVNRYISYLCPTEHQLRSLKGKLLETTKTKLANVISGKDTMDDSYVKVSSLNFVKEGTAYAVELSTNEIYAVRIEKKGDDIEVYEERTTLRTAEVDLTSPHTTAYQLFTVVASTVAKVLEPGTKGIVPLSFVCGFPVFIWSNSSMYLRTWTMGVNTGRNTDDQVEGGDIAAMLQYAFQRMDLPFKIEACLNDQSAAAILGAAELDPNVDGKLRFTAYMGNGFSVGTVYDRVDHLRVRGEVINLSPSDSLECLPTTDIDIEVDWADDSLDERRIEKMVAGVYLGEIARRVVLKIFEEKSPILAWSRGSLPLYVCSRIVEDESDDCSVCKEIMKHLWDWELDTKDARHVIKIVRSVFIRAAALTSACIVAGIQSQNALQPALGNSIIIIRGSLYKQSLFYRDMVKKNIEFIVGNVLSRLVVLNPLKGSVVIGGALYLLARQ